MGWFTDGNVLRSAQELALWIEWGSERATSQSCWMPGFEWVSLPVMGNCLGVKDESSTWVMGREGKQIGGGGFHLRHIENT